MSLIRRSLDSPVSLPKLAFHDYHLRPRNCTNQSQEGQVQPFYLETTDNEQLFCWHVLPLDVYLQNEEQLAMATTTGEVADEFKGTMGEKLLRTDPESKVVVNFHGVSQRFRITCSNLNRLLVSTSTSGTSAQCLTVFVKSNAIIERRPRRSRLASSNLPLDLWHPPHPPSNLRLPRLRTLHAEQRTSPAHRKRHHHRRSFSAPLHQNHPQPPDNPHCAPRPKPRHRRHSRLSPLLRRPLIPRPAL